MSSYLLNLERLRVKLRNILRTKGFTLADNTDLSTLVNKVDGIGTYNQIKSILTNDAYVINDTEGLITVVTNAILAGSKITSLILPECTGIGYNRSPYYAFKGCTYLETVDLPKCVELTDYSFQNCSALVNVNIPKIETIQRSSFAGCTSLRQFVLPNTIRTLGDGSIWASCTAFNELIIERTDAVQSIPNTSLFSSTPFRNSEGGIVYVPDNLVSSYQADSKWGSLESTTFKGLSELE